MKVSNSEYQELDIRKRAEKIFNTTSVLCPIRDIVAPLLDKWSISILLHLGCSQSLRFGVLKESISGISARMLTVSLKKLAHSGLIKRKIYGQIPPKVEYSLTVPGQAFTHQILNLTEWASEHAKEIAKHRKSTGFGR